MIREIDGDLVVMGELANDLEKALSTQGFQSLTDRFANMQSSVPAQPAANTTPAPASATGTGPAK
jgi:hypothetical protein